MKKRFIALTLTLILAFAAAIPAQAAAGSLDNFKVQRAYSTGRFTDVDGAAWYAMDVQASYEYGLMNGAASGAFIPSGTLTVAEAIKIADCLNSVYYTGRADFKEGAPWYATYVDYAVKNGIIASAPADYSKAVTRAEFAGMIARALPGESFASLGQIEDGAIPDVSASDSFGQSVYTLYRAGVLTGCDSFGTFRPDAPLSRAEAAAIAARAADKGFRKSLTLPVPLSGADIYSKCAPAVFYLERYDSEGVLIGIGSGFFISRDGLAVTNYHVIDGAANAIITTADGTQYPVKGICGYDKVKDIAVLQIDGTGFPYLSVADSDQLQVGAHVYAIGSPFGLLNTISDGVVSNARQDLNDSSFIQFSAPISMGSGGGPILNAKGQVVGIACLTVLNGQTLNFAVPINDLSGLSKTGSVPLITIVAKNSASTLYYRSYFPVPDYGVFAGTPLYRTSLDQTTGVKTYYYRLSDITVGEDTAVNGYVGLLNKNGFSWQSSYKNDSGHTVDVYYNPFYDMSVHFGADVLDGVDCRVVAIY
ncbi:S-layer homology domain-containing protein [Sporobacter termitidis DSM 10068]|uniref:S-layer homology domain-containing protein n=1 Tax=Sporobacter termitidis DSM 10068 TaxID=1123282 RepID=A0A1M5YFE3_9FIRM|nr:trypsin-like peptidase domain-containing protein [Sporobacter termitidis]SHI10614.1 S-layer homology domain-containing protein [Sporobacter termitidis DSM 10068]